jgi:DNA polymerase-4
MKLHIDIDCFFVSAHRINDKSLSNIPLAVGGRSNLSIFKKEKTKKSLSQIQGAFTSSILSNTSHMSFDDYFVDIQDGKKKIRGIITTASYEARDYGVKTAMSVAESLRLCPQLKVLPPNYPLYHQLSYALKALLEKEIPKIEQFSIDEFFGDISGWIDDRDAYMFGMYLKNEIYEKLKLPVSIGIAPSKWTAKLATNEAKPEGVFSIMEDELEEYIKNIPLKAFPGIGKGFYKRLQGHGINTLGDIKAKKELFLRWGKNGIQLYNRILGIDKEEVVSNIKDKKSIGIGRTFDVEFNRSEIIRRIVILSRHLSFLALKDNHIPTMYGIKIRYKYGEKSKEYCNTNRLFSESFCKQIMCEMFYKIDIHPTQGIIQLNLHLSNFLNEKKETLNLLHYKEDVKAYNLSLVLQKLRIDYGIDIIKTAKEV